MKITIKVEVYENVIVNIEIPSTRDGYKILNQPKWVGKKIYPSFANHVADSFAEQYPDLEYEIRKNQRGESPAL